METHDHQNITLQQIVQQQQQQQSVMALTLPQPTIRHSEEIPSNTAILYEASNISSIIKQQVPALICTT